jgi:arylformamidase
VFEATAASSLDALTLETAGVRGERVLLKTRNLELWSRDAFAEDFLSLGEDGAMLLVERGVRLVGIDYLSIGDEAAHQVLLEAGVVSRHRLEP